LRSEAIKGLTCSICSWELPVEPFAYLCPKCGGNLDFEYDHALISRDWSRDSLKTNPERSIWRYLPLLPVKRQPENVSLQIGGTPLVSLPLIAQAHKLKTFQIKDDSRNPSFSLKDRATELAIQHAQELGRKTLVGASTGNAGSSLAALTAHHGLRSIILAPASAPRAKLIQIRQHGAILVPVDDNYDQAFDLAFEWSRKHRSYCRNTGVNPILAEGKKTVALEIAEQNDWQVPDHVFVPVGDGCIISGVYKGFLDLLKLGWIEKMPALHAVQAEGSAAIVDSLKQTGKIEAVTAQTIADSISVDLPRDGYKARRAVLESKGMGHKVSDEEILTAQLQLSRETGIFAEPAAAAAFAGFLKASGLGLFSEEEHVVVLSTGSGLKDTASAQKLLPRLTPVEAKLSAIETFLNQARG